MVTTRRALCPPGYSRPGSFKHGIISFCGGCGAGNGTPQRVRGEWDALSHAHRARELKLEHRHAPTSSQDAAHIW